MGDNPICEAILDGPWRLRPGVTEAVIQPSHLLTTGVCHIKIPTDLARAYSVEGEAVHWLSTVKDGESLELDKNPWIESRFDVGTPHRTRIDWEENNWHYDISSEFSKLTDRTNYNVQSTVGPIERANRARQAFLRTVPFPIDYQGPTVCVPWSGKHAGKLIQAPMGYATVFDPHACWHRGDRWMGSRRGVLMQSIRMKIR